MTLQQLPHSMTQLVVVGNNVNSRNEDAVNIFSLLNAPENALRGSWRTRHGGMREGNVHVRYRWKAHEVRSPQGPTAVSGETQGEKNHKVMGDHFYNGKTGRKLVYRLLNGSIFFFKTNPLFVVFFFPGGGVFFSSFCTSFVDSLTVDIGGLLASLSKVD